MGHHRNHDVYAHIFPTKRHWKGKSRMEDIDSGLQALIDVVKGGGIQSIAVPPLGSGNGGLDWNEVRPRIEKPLPCCRMSVSCFTNLKGHRQLVK
jgi:O-acetyl-ADP-ribose deacetylase (regulator of RNase III)